MIRKLAKIKISFKNTNDTKQTKENKIKRIDKHFFYSYEFDVVLKINLFYKD